jgi:hypothetical protein
MHGPMNVKSPNNTSKWQMGFNSAFKGLIKHPNDFFCLIQTKKTLELILKMFPEFEVLVETDKLA